MADLVAMAEFKDRRLQERLATLIDKLEEGPSLSFPQVFQDSADLEACYRFLSNVKVTPEAILSSHYEEVAARAALEDEVIVVHDTTQFFYGVDSNRRGLGRIRKANNAFFAHVSLVLSTHGYRRPFGIAALQTLVRNGETDNEYARWSEGVTLARNCLGTTKAVHLMDREADDYTLLCKLVSSGERFVIRSRNDRMLGDSLELRLSDVLNAITGELEREVQLTKRTDGERPPASKKKHPVRESRIAQLAIGAAKIAVRKPEGRTKSAASYGPRPDFLEMHVVRVWEPSPPVGEEPIEWALLTTERIDTVEQIARVVDLYRTRWTIEEYFKALKTGCSMEKRQLMDYESLCNALAVFVPIACRALSLRAAAHDLPDAKAVIELDADELQVLKLQKPKYLSENPTNREVLMAVASMGGHIKWNGAPGWITLLRGMQQLTLITLGWRLGKLQPVRDQS